MLIELIKLSNWRSFYGTNEIHVSTSTNKNVTLIRAENGVGKTSLLAAINWCFFDILPSEGEFENPQKLVNEFAKINNGVSETTVEIDFIHDGKTYRASRSYDQKNKRTTPLRLSAVLDGGEVPSSSARPDRFINSVIPREMAPHFFFYGEATSKYTGSSGAKKFGEAVKGILGSTIARMALSDLDKVFKDYNRQAADNTSEEARQVEANIEKNEALIAEKEENLKRLEGEIDAANNRVDKLNRELAGTKPAKEAQARRTKLEAQLNAKESEKEKALLRSSSWMQNYATSVMAEELVSEAGDVIEKDDTRGKLPAPYDKKFVDEILDDEVCICGRPFDRGGVEFERIKKLLDTAGDQVVMSRVMSTNIALGKLTEKASNAWRIFKRNNEDLQRIETELSSIDADLLDISNELDKNPVADIGHKEAARTRAISQRKNAESNKVEILSAITNLKRSKDDFKRKLSELLKKSDAARRYVKRAQLSAALVTRLQARLKAEEENARAAIEKDIDEIVQKFMRKPASVKLDNNYQLRLFDERNNELAKSTGENQLLGLAFTGAIAKYAKERDHDDSDILLPGTVAPLVVDSPFGHLDPTYRRGVAEFLPKLASQVILLASTSQASETVMKTLSDRIGEEYVLTRYNSSDGAGKQDETIEIGGKTFELTSYGSEFEGTRVIEVRQ